METLVLYAVLVLARVGAFVIALPLFGATQTPRLVKFGLTLALTLFYLSCLFPQLPPDGAAARLSWLGIGLSIGREIFIGALWGYAFSFLLAPAQMAGEYITLGLNLNFGSLISGTGTTATSPISQILEALAIMLFLGMDGHHVFFAILHSSFATHPIGGAVPQIPLHRLVGGLQVAVEYGLILAAPVAMCLYLSTITLSLLSRAAPQMNLYAVGFPLQLAVGLFALLLFLPTLGPALVLVLGRMKEMVLYYLT